MFLLARGPTLLSLSTLSIIVPYLCSYILATALTPHILITLTLTTLGLYLTISDCLNFIQCQINCVKKRIREYATQNITLDIVLRNIFSLDASNGALGCILSTFISTVGMYSIPFSAEQRANLLQPFLPTSIDARRVLFTPGGYIDCLNLSDYWKCVLLGEGKENDKKSHGDITNNRVKENDDKLYLELNDDERIIHAMQQQQNINDLTWDNEDQETELESLIDDGTPCINNPTREAHNPSQSHGNQPQHQVTDENKPEDVCAEHRICLQQTNSSVSLSSFPHTTTKTPSTPITTKVSDPFETLQKVFKQMLIPSIESSLKAIDNDQIRKIGIVATISLLIQLKTSRTARRIVWNTLNASVSFSLIGIAFASFGTLRVKDKVQFFLDTVVQEDENDDARRRRRANLNSLLTQTPENVPHTKSFILIKQITNFIISLRNDQRFTRQWKGIFGIIMIYCYRSKRKRTFKGKGSL